MGTRVARFTRAGLGLLGACVVVIGLAVWTHTGRPAAGAKETASTSGRQITAPEKELLRRAEERLIRKCMSRQGFTYVEQPPATPAARTFPYVVDDLAWARTYGYGGLSTGPAASERDANYANLRKLSPGRQQAWMDAVMGTGRQLTAEIPDLGRVSAPDNGCTAEARRTLYGDLAGWYRVRRIVDHLDTYVGNLVRQDRRYQTAVAAWSRCVGRDGYQADSPQRLRDVVSAQTADLAPAQAHQAEVAAAVAEATCASTTGLSQNIRAMERSYRPRVQRRFADEQAALSSYEQRAVPVARRVLAGS